MSGRFSDEGATRAMLLWIVAAFAAGVLLAVFFW